MLSPSRLPGRLAFGPDGTLLAAGGALIDAANGQLLRILRGQLSPVTGVGFAPDGAALAAGSFDGTVRVQGVADGIARAVITLDSNDWASDVGGSPSTRGCCPVRDPAGAGTGGQDQGRSGGARTRLR